MNNDNNIEEEDEDFVAHGGGDDDDDDDVDDGDDEDDDDDDDIVEDNVIDGGAAYEEGNARGRTTSTADITLILCCMEKFKDYPNHPVLQLGSKVQIALDKNTKLSAVMARYLEVCNQAGQTDLAVADLEFIHVEHIRGQDTVEGAALMKNDIIQVRPDRTAERAAQVEMDRIQREIDKDYFAELRTLLDGHQKYADVYLNCQDSLEENGSNLVPCHSKIVSRRCPWLAREIHQARLASRSSNVTKLRERQQLSNSKESDEDDIQMLDLNVRRQEGPMNRGAAQIENDEDEDKILKISIPYPPEAVKILLEYCYTNRVPALGRDAFLQSCRTKPFSKKLSPPVPPFSHGVASGRRWPNRGNPTLLFAAVLAGIALAEEATLPRLSLMCEIAAAQLVGPASAIDALALCQRQKDTTGNDLPRLRKAAMNVMLHNLSRDYLSPRKTLNLNPDLVPTLLTGALEAVQVIDPKLKSSLTIPNSGSKRDWQSMMAPIGFDSFDRIDMHARDQERRRWRSVGHHNNRPARDESTESAPRHRRTRGGKYMSMKGMAD